MYDNAAVDVFTGGAGGALLLVDQCFQYAIQLTSVQAQIQAVNCVAPLTLTGSLKAYFDSSGFIAAYFGVPILQPSGSTPTPSLYQQLITSFAPAYTEINL